MKSVELKKSRDALAKLKLRLMPTYLFVLSWYYILLKCNKIHNLDYNFQISVIINKNVMNYNKIYCLSCLNEFG